MRIQLPQYSGKDYKVLSIVIVPFTFGLNSAIFGNRYFTNGSIFIIATLLTAAIFSIYFISCSNIAMVLKRRIPDEIQSSKRLFILICSIIALSGIFLMILFRSYELFPSFNYAFYDQGFIWAYVSMAIVNIFLTLLIEGIYRYDKWRENLKETERIKKLFTQSQLLGLKSQVNPHFLFNSLNTLSSLIEEDEKEAEKFLNQMSKVYRYMLQGDDEQFVSVETEIKFIESYIYLLRKRYGQSLEVNLRIAPEDHDKLIPPLSLQILIENALTQNSMSKGEPLFIFIDSGGNNELLISNSLKPKLASKEMDLENSLDNLIAKYRLLNASEVQITDSQQQRKIVLPLFQNSEVIS